MAGEGGVEGRIAWVQFQDEIAALQVFGFQGGAAHADFHENAIERADGADHELLRLRVGALPATAASLGRIAPEIHRHDPAHLREFALVKDEDDASEADGDARVSGEAHAHDRLAGDPLLAPRLYRIGLDDLHRAEERRAMEKKSIAPFHDF